MECLRFRELPAGQNTIERVQLWLHVLLRLQRRGVAQGQRSHRGVREVVALRQLRQARLGRLAGIAAEEDGDEQAVACAGRDLHALQRRELRDEPCSEVVASIMVWLTGLYDLSASCPRSGKGEKVGCFGLTEPDAGSMRKHGTNVSDADGM